MKKQQHEGILENVVMALDGPLKVARQVFEKEYGVRHDDKAFDVEINAIIEDALRYDPPCEKPEVPLRILLAIRLREGSLRGRGPKAKSAYQVVHEEYAMDNVRKRRAELIEQGETAAEATKQAVEDCYKSSTLSRAAILDRLARRPRWAQRRRG